MHRQIGAILLIAGTCIGSGMIALPMVLANLGLLPSILLMLGIWSVTYFTSLVNLELNLTADQGLSLGRLGQHFSGPIAATIGTVSLFALSYALLAVFIYAGASVLQNLLDTQTSTPTIAGWQTFFAAGVLLLPITWVDYLNRLLFIALLAVIALLIAGLVTMITWGDLPLVSAHVTNLSAWCAVLPVVFTSFGFQVIFHTLTNYCHKNAGMLKRAFFWGSLIPALVYIIWTCSVLSVVHHENPMFYTHMAAGKVDVGDLVRELSTIAEWHTIQLLVWWISFLSIITSLLGVGVGLCDSLKQALAARVSSPFLRPLIAAATTMIPAYLVAILVPNAFIAVLGFAGMILVIIAILLPLYLLRAAEVARPHYPLLQNSYLLSISAVVGWLIIASELWNILNK